MSEKLMSAMINMQEQEALALVKELMANGEDPMKILQVCTQAMETVGQRFEAGDYFLPELMMAYFFRLTTGQVGQQPTAY